MDEELYKLHLHFSKLVELSPILRKWGHTLTRYDKYMRVAFYDVEHRNIVSMSISTDLITNISIKIKSSSIELYKNHGYKIGKLYHDDSVDIVWLAKSVQSIEGLLDELQELGLINCGHTIKSGNGRQKDRV